MKVLLAPDKFKGSLTAAEVAEHLARGLTERGVDHRTLPLADGGDGSVAAALHSGFEPVPLTVSGATGHPTTAVIALDGGTAVVEVANTCGLQTLPDNRRAPLTASSRGFGEAIAHALQLGARRLVLALGGSASTDGGAGMLAALGAVFSDHRGRTLTDLGGGTLSRIAHVDLTALSRFDGVHVAIASDVGNPLVGPTGSPAVYGPQKGAGPPEINVLAHGLRHVVACIAQTGREDAWRLAHAPGAGAAGGIGFAAMLLGGHITSGADYFLDLLGFPAALEDCDLVITGEGGLDGQTERGKLPAAVARRASGVPVVAIVGRSEIDAEAAAALGFTAVHALRDQCDTDPATDPHLSAQLLQRLATTIHLPGRTSTAASAHDE